MRVFKFLAEAEMIPVFIGPVGSEVEYELRELSGGQVQEFRKAAIEGVTYDESGNPQNFAAKAIETESRLVGAAMFPKGGTTSVGKEFAAGLRNRILKDLAKEARRLNGLEQPGDDPEADKKKVDEKKISTPSKETGIALPSA